jgi:hypothetical protein
MGIVALLIRGARAIAWAGVRILIVAAVLSVVGCASYAERHPQANGQGVAAAGLEAQLADRPKAPGGPGGDRPPGTAAVGPSSQG